ncbi:WD repeat-containing protein 37-like [Planococcus citri]|uniref:WD repeat-containing protein 37-like n=1 Tax=Planococcus citri TaxID=170843 RepID=UPI0031F8D051
MPQENLPQTKTKPKGSSKFQISDMDFTQFLQNNYQTDLDVETSLPPAYKARLQELFFQIEKEFENLYLENVTLQEKIERLHERFEKEGLVNEKLASENTDVESVTNSVRSSTKQKLSSQQKLKATHKLKAQTSKIVSSFKTPTLNCSMVREFNGHKDGIWDVGVAQNGQPLIGTASADYTARIWNTESSECLLQYAGHTGSVNSLRFHPTKDLILTASGDQTVHIWQAVVNWEHIKSASSDEEPVDLKETDDLGLDGVSSILRTPVRSLLGHSNVVMAADWLPGGDQVITASWDRTALLYDVETGDLLQSLSGHDQELMHASAHHSQKLVVTSSRDTTFRLWDFREPIHSVSVFQGHTQTVTCTVFAKKCDDKVVSGSDDRTVKIWDLRNMRSSLATIRLDSGINRLAISPSGLIAIPHDNRQIRLYDLLGQRIARLPRTSRQGHRRMVCGVAWNEDNASCNFFSCGFDRRILGWLIQSNKD